MRQTLLLCWLIGGLITLSACSVSQGGEPTLPPTYVEVPYTELVFEELDRTALADPGIPGCTLADLPAFHWKEVNSGLVDIRTPEAYAIQTESLYQEGYLSYQQARVEYPDRYQANPEMSYEAFLATCNVFPEVDFEQYSVLGAQAMGTGCTVAFEKHVYRDDQSKTVRYEIQAIEEGACETVTYKRINQWVSDATGERIADLADPRNWDNLTRLILTNAIAFDGLWQQPFDGDTKKVDFTLLDASTVRVPLMQRYATITPYAAGEGW